MKEEIKIVCSDQSNLNHEQYTIGGNEYEKTSGYTLDKSYTMSLDIPLNGKVNHLIECPVCKGKLKFILRDVHLAMRNNIISKIVLALSLLSLISLVAYLIFDSWLDIISIPVPISITMKFLFLAIWFGWIPLIGVYNYCAEKVKVWEYKGIQERNNYKHIVSDLKEKFVQAN